MLDCQDHGTEKMKTTVATPTVATVLASLNSGVSPLLGKKHCR